MADAARQSLYDVDRRSRWPRRHRLRRVRRAGNLPDRQGRHHSLQADRTDHGRSIAAEDPAHGARAAKIMRATLLGVTLAIAFAASATKMDATDAALDLRLKKL